MLGRGRPGGHPGNERDSERGEVMFIPDLARQGLVIDFWSAILPRGGYWPVGATWPPVLAFLSSRGPFFNSVNIYDNDIGNNYGNNDNKIKDNANTTNDKHIDKY